MAIIKLVTISRISKEKGFERMLIMERMLTDAGIRFIWDCYGDTSTKYAKLIIPQFAKVKFKGVTKKPLKELKRYDYLVQLSDTEGFPYSIYEALSVLKPCIVSDFKSVHELIEDGVNGFILPQTMDYSIKNILRIPTITDFKEKSSEKDWQEII